MRTSIWSESPISETRKFFYSLKLRFKPLRCTLRNSSWAPAFIVIKPDMKWIYYMCRITVNFGTLKDNSLQINSLTSSSFSVTKTSSKMASILRQKLLNIFCHKAQNFLFKNFQSVFQMLKIKCGETLYFQHVQCQDQQW